MTIEQMKAEFNRRKHSYNAKQGQLKSLEAEKAQAENMKMALEAELEDIIAKTQTSLANNKILTADKYAELKTADFNVKAKIEYYQAVIEDLEEKIYSFKESLFLELEKLRHYREELFNKLLFACLEDFKKAHSEDFNAMYQLFIHSSDMQYQYNENKTFSEQAKPQFLNLFKPLLISEINPPEEYKIVNLTPDFTPKSPMRKHREEKEQELGITEPKGFQKLIKNLIK